MEIGGVVGDRSCSCLVPPIRVRVDGGTERTKFLIKFFFELSDGFAKVFFGYERVGINGITHSLNFVGDDISYGSLR